MGLTTKGRTGAAVLGEAGVGKTRLMEEVADLSRRDEWSVEWVRATAAARNIQLGSFAHLCPISDVPRDREDLLHMALGRLLDGSTVSPRLLVVDDAHLLDELSVALLHLVVTQSPIQVLASVRTDETALPAGLLALWKDRSLTPLHLDRLSRDDTEELVGALLGDNSAPAALERIWRVSRGNPLVICELLDAAAPWKVALWDYDVVTSDRKVHERLRMLVDDRLAALSKESRAALEVVAVGDQVPVAVVEALTGAAQIEALEADRLVEVRQISGPGYEGMLQVIHPLYGEVLVACLSPVRRRSILGSLARVGHDLRGVDPLRLATWQLESGIVGSPSQMVDLAREALGRLDHRLAERIAEAGGGIMRVDTGLVLGEALTGQGRLQEADKVLAALRPDGPEHIARVAVARADLCWRLQRADDSLTILEIAADQLADHPEWQAECRSMLALLLRYQVRYDAAGAIVDELLAARVSGAARVRTVVVATALRGVRGEAQGCLDLLTDDVYDLAHRHRRDVPFAESQLHATRIQALRWLMRFHEMEELTSRDDGVLDWSPPGLRAIKRGLRGFTLLYRGRPQAAVDELQGALATTESDWLGLRAVAYAVVCRAAATAGDVEVAGAALESAERQAAEDAATGVDLHPAIELSRAWLLAACGDRSAATEHCLSVAEQFSQRAVWTAIELLHCAVRLGACKEAIGVLERLTQAVDGPSVGQLVRHARALIDRDGPELEAVAREFAALGADLLAAEAYRSAGNAYREQGGGTLARGAHSRAELLLRVCGNPRSPGLEPIVGVTALTRREREVAELAAVGRSNGEIALSLYISVRTVETHLQNAYGKLGIERRQQLPEVLK